MTGLRGQFPAALRAVVVVLLVTAAVAAYVAWRARRVGASRAPAVPRVLFAGTALAVVAATVLLHGVPDGIARDGDVVLAVGRGGLRDWRVVLTAPTSLAALLLYGNVVMFVPLGVFGAFGWPGRSAWVLVGCAALSASIELTQAAVLGRVGATDDWLLNTAGAACGLLIARRR